MIERRREAGQLAVIAGVVAAGVAAGVVCRMIGEAGRCGRRTDYFHRHSSWR